jgi:hypothetical protein
MNRYPLHLVFFFLTCNLVHAQRMPAQKKFVSKPLFTVESALWCEEVSAKGVPSHPLERGHLSKSIYFWVKLRAKDEKAIQVLREIENPVIMKLFKSTGYGTSAEWSKESQQNELMNRKESIERKREELAKNGEFTYATWVKLDRTHRPGTYVVKLVFYDNSPVECDDGPCSYELKIDK